MFGWFKRKPKPTWYERLGITREEMLWAGFNRRREEVGLPWVTLEDWRNNITPEKTAVREALTVRDLP